MSKTRPIQRYDDYAGVMSHAGKYPGGTALIVLGGYSAKDWESLYAEVKPDVLLGANGVNAKIPHLDYWMIVENMRRSLRLAGNGDPDALAYMEMLNREMSEKTIKLVSQHSWNIIGDTRNCIRIRIQGYELDKIPDDFTFRDYGIGYLAGWELKQKGVGAPVNVGTVALQLLHHAGILGVAEVHTIGFDLVFRNQSAHHWYDYPTYKTGRYREESMFTTYKGVETLWTWIETAQYMKEIEYMFERDGITWKDHSNGLLQIEELECAR